MADELEVSSTPQAAEPTAAPATNDQATATPELDNSQPVTSLDQAKAVLAKQTKTPAAPKKTSAAPPVNYETQYKELQKLTSSHSKELGDLRKYYKENQPAVEAYKQFLQQQQEQELLGKYQTDPAAVIRELARREAAQQIAPYQEQMSQAQATQINASIKEQLGSDYDQYAPIMADMLDQFLAMDSQNGSTYATELAQNPHVLMQLAAGRMALEARTQNAQQQQQAQQTKAQNLRTASGVGKGNQVQSTPTDNFGSLTLDEMRQQMQKMGLIRK